VIQHPLQLKILKQLLYKQKAKFSDFSRFGVAADLFVFHLNRLIKLELVSKDLSGYTLTPKGMELAGRINLKTNAIHAQPKVSVMTFAIRRSHGRKEILLSERLTDPIRGFVSCQTSKVEAGESLTSVAQRCFVETTGLTGEMEFVGVYQYSHFKDNSLVESTVINCFRARKLSGKLKYETSKVKNFWYNFNDAQALKNVYPEFANILQLISKRKTFYKEAALNQ
jgi:ADP-ribose pyrophosphatase YjhB (NUDIX family)